MNYYKIKAVLHSGTKGERHKQREDDKYPMLKNRIVEFDKNDIMIGLPLYLNYIKDENGNDYRDGLGLRTSSVLDIPIEREDMIVFETFNSIYVLEKIEMVDGIVVEDLDREV